MVVDVILAIDALPAVLRGSKTASKKPPIDPPRDPNDHSHLNHNPGTMAEWSEVHPEAGWQRARGACDESLAYNINTLMSP